MAVFNARRYVSFPGVNLRAVSGAIRFETPSITPTTTSGERLLYVNSSNQLIFDSGSTTLNISTLSAGGGGTLDAAYDGGRSITADAGEILFTITTAANGLSIDKTNTGAGVPLVLANAGTGIDLDVTNTNQGDATGIITQFHYDAVSPADDDIPLEIRINADDDGGTETTLSTVRWYQRDVTAATDDAEFYMSLMVAGTERQVLQIDDDTVEIGNGNAAAVLSSQGAFDLVLETNRGTNTGTITITDGVNGNIQIAPDGTGILDLNSGFDIDASSTETCTITVVGTTGDGLAIDSSTITSGAVVMINHSASGTLDGGQLLDLQIDGTSYYTFGEVAFNIVGTAGSNSFTMTAGDVVWSDTSLAITDADNAASFTVTNNTVTTAAMAVITGSGTFTGTGTSSFVTITPTGATTGTGLYIALAAATTLSYALDITTSTTTGTAARLTNTGILTGVGAALSIIADSATTPGNSAGEGVVNISADGLTTGAALNVESLSNELMTSGHLADFAHSAVGTTIAAKTGSVFRVTSSMTESGTSTQDYDVMAITRTSVHDTAGTLTAQGSALRLEVVSTETGATLTDTVAGLEIVLGAVSGGDAINITHSGTTTGQALVVTASQTSVDGVLNLTGNSVDSGRFIVADVNALTTGIGLEVTHTTSVITTGSVCRLTSTGVDTGTGQGTLLDLVSSGTTAAKVVSLVADALATGIGLFFSFDGLTTGEGISVTHTTSVIADGGSLFRLSSTGIDTGGATNGTVFDLSSTAQLAGVVSLETCSALTTGTAHRIVADAVTSGILLDLETSDATFSGNYIRCYDGAAVDFSVGEDGRVVLAGAAGITAIAVTAGDITTADGAIASARQQVTLGAAATAIAVDSNVVEVTGDAGGNTVTTITGGVAGQYLTLLFVDALVTINDDNTHGADSVDLVGANTTFADDATLTLIYDGTSWYEVSRSIND